MSSSGEDRVLLRTTAAQQQVFHAIDGVQLRRVYVTVEDDDVEILRVHGDRLVGILTGGDSLVPERAKADRCRIGHGVGPGTTKKPAEGGLSC